MVQLPHQIGSDRLAPGAANGDVAFAPMAKCRPYAAVLPLRCRFREANDYVLRFRLAAIELRQLARPLAQEHDLDDLDRHAGRSRRLEKNEQLCGLVRNSWLKDRVE